MIAGCPKCGAKYRVDPARLGSEGARLRCVKCEAVFRARAPEPTPVAPVAPAQGAPAPERIEATAPKAPPVVDPTAAGTGRSRLVLIADADVESGKRSAAAVTAWGLEPLLVHDGVEAMLTIQRRLPSAVILDAALPKMYGFQICEMMKRNASLREIGVILVASVHRSGRYRRPPVELYGADVYVEQPDLPDALRSPLQAFGLPVGDTSASCEDVFTAPSSAGPAPIVEHVPAPAVEVLSPPPVPPPAPPSSVPEPPVEAIEAAVPSFDIPAPVFVAPTSAPAPDVVPVEKAGADDPLAEARANAERLARIIVSDIVLYNEEEFAAGLLNGDVVRRLDAALEEGRGLFRQRVDESVRDESDYLVEELVRVARSRGMA